MKQLGFSLQEIKYYLQNCNIETTQDLLSKSLKIVNSKIQELSEIKKTIEVKKNYMKKIESLEITNTITIKELFHYRYYLMSKSSVSTETELSYQVIRLENKINQLEYYSPIFASNRYMGFYQNCIEDNQSPIIGIEVKKNLRDYSNLKKVPQGKYLTLTYEGEFWNAQVYINKLINHSKNHHISITNNFIQTQWLDYTFVNEKNKLVYEIQVKML